MGNKKNIGGIIALSLGILLVVGSVITIIILKVKSNEDTDITDLDLESINSNSSNGQKETTSTLSVKQIKAIQTYLLQVGIQNNNQYIIDAIQLTGGIDGKMGSGLRAAIQEAKDKGYLSGYEDILQRLGY